MTMKKKALEKDSSAPAMLTEDDIKCPICLYLLVEPVRMPCNHCLCKLCFESNIQQTALQCPVCRARIGTFARRSVKSGTLVDQKLWTTIKKQFKEQLRMQHLDNQERAAAKITTAKMLPSEQAAPGEIRREFEKQMQQIRLSHQSPGQERQQEADRTMAATLQGFFDSQASTSEPLSGMITPANRVPPEDEDDEEGEEEEEEESSDEEDSDEEETTTKSSSRRLLFNNLSNASCSDSDQPRRPGSRKSGPLPKKGRGQSRENKENHFPNGKRRRPSKEAPRSQQFPGCSKKMKMLGTTPLTFDSFVESSSDEEVAIKSKQSSCAVATTSRGKSASRGKQATKPSSNKAGIIPPSKGVQFSVHESETQMEKNSQQGAAKISEVPTNYEKTWSEPAQVQSKNKRAKLDSKSSVLVAESKSSNSRSANGNFILNEKSRKSMGEVSENQSSSSEESNFLGFSPTVQDKTGVEANRRAENSGNVKTRRNINNNIAMNSSSSSSNRSSGYGSLSSTATVSPCTELPSTSTAGAAPALPRRSNRSLDDLQQVALALITGLPLDKASSKAVVAEQRALELILKQESEDEKLARKLQRQLTKLSVDRSAGSGEEYSLRSRGSRSPRRARVTVRTTRDTSPCY